MVSLTFEKGCSYEIKDNNRLPVIFKEVESRLNERFSVDSVLLYSTLPAISSGAYSIQVVREQNPFLLVRRWDKEYMWDNQQVPGIYRLDGIIMREKGIDLSQDNVDRLLDPRMLNNIAINDHDRILLDGIIFGLSINTAQRIGSFTWDLSEQLHHAASHLIGVLRELAGIEWLTCNNLRGVYRIFIYAYIWLCNPVQTFLWSTPCILTSINS